MGVAVVNDKPLARDSFVTNLIWMIQQERGPSEEQSQTRKIRALLAKRNLKEALPLKAEMLASPKVSLAKKRLIEGEFAFAEGDYALARDAAVEALKSAGDSILVLNLLGKTFMRLSEFESALKCFKKAQELSPQNIERLCSMAEAHTELGQEDAAKDAIEEATTLDASSSQIQEAKVKCALAKGDTDTAKQHMAELESLSTLLGYMNNKAVALAKTGNTDDATTLYENTIKSIPEKRQDMVAIVKYNLALALVRASDFERALKVLEEALAIKQSRIAKKGASLQIRLKKAIESGANLDLKGAHGEEQEDSKEDAAGDGEAKRLSTAEDLAQMIARVESKRGDQCCFKVFNMPGGLEAKTESLLANQPRFQFRAAIAREEALGAERTRKAG